MLVDLGISREIADKMTANRHLGTVAYKDRAIDGNEKFEPCDDMYLYGKMIDEVVKAASLSQHLGRLLPEISEKCKLPNRQQRWTAQQVYEQLYALHMGTQSTSTVAATMSTSAAAGGTAGAGAYAAASPKVC